MKLLVTMPHFYDASGSGKYGLTGPNTDARAYALGDCLAGLRQSLGPNQAFLYCLHQQVCFRAPSSSDNAGGIA